MRFDTIEVQKGRSSEETPLLRDGEKGPLRAYQLSPREQRATSIWSYPPFILAFLGSFAAFAVVITVVVGTFLIDGLDQDSGSNIPSTTTSICMTPACVHASSEILYNLSPNYKNIDPCEDFETLVCGGWDDRHDLRPDQGDAFTGTIMFENSQTLLRHILEAPYPGESKHSSFSPAQLVNSLSSTDQHNFNKLKDAYNACMDEDKIKKVGISPLAEILKQVSDMYSAQSGSPDLGDSILFLAKLGVSTFVMPAAGADDTDPDTVVVVAAPPYRIGLPAKDYYKDDSVVGKYENTISDVFAGLSKHTSFDIFNIAETNISHGLVEFEKKLAAASPDAADQNDVTKYYNPMTLKEADSLAPNVKLAKILNGLVPRNFKIERLIVMSPSYIEELGNITSNTSKEVIEAYLLWKTIQAFASDVESDELKPYRRFMNELQGKDPDSTPERWRTCIGHVDGGLGWILSRFFVEKAFSEKAKVFGDQIVSDIKEQFIEKLKVTEWMDKSVIELAIEKVHKIVQKIGYPTKSPNIMDPSTLSDYYKSVAISPSTFFSNSLSMSRFEVARMWSSLGKPVDRDEWGMTVPTVNAYYNPPGNEIVFPAGIMQFPVFDVNVPQYLSYGAFGSVSGHELSHAFDSTGRHYDQNGNYTDWWTNSTVAAFKEHAECFVSQYANFTVPALSGPPLHVNGKLTLGENIADAGGVSAAFAAWKKRAAETPNEDLPGLEFFTQDQLFFVNYANWWCGKSTLETAVQRVYTDPHAPKWARIIGTMANSRDFKESFKCEVKEPVCEIW